MDTWGKENSDAQCCQQCFCRETTFSLLINTSVRRASTLRKATILKAFSGVRLRKLYLPVTHQLSPTRPTRTDGSSRLLEVGYCSLAWRSTCGICPRPTHALRRKERAHENQAFKLKLQSTHYVVQWAAKTDFLRTGLLPGLQAAIGLRKRPSLHRSDEQVGEVGQTRYERDELRGHAVQVHATC